MNVFDICAKVCDCCVGVFFKESVGMVDIPEGGKIVAGKDIEKVTQSFGVCIKTDCFNKKSNVILLSFADESADK